MSTKARFLSVDLGASSGRVMAAHWDGRRFELEELHRFCNSGIRVGDRLYWDVLHIWSEMKEGLSKFSMRYRESPASIGVDAWGVDFALLDAAGRLLGNPVHYRDERTQGVPEALFAKVRAESLFAETGVQPWQINTLFQLYSMVIAEDPQLASAATLLTIPDLFSYFLCGAKRVEYTEATTTQMYSYQDADWSRNTLTGAGIPLHILPEIVRPGTVLGMTQKSVLEDCGSNREFPVVAVASHDTASAVAAIPGLEPSSAFISSGTWSLMGTEVAQPNVSATAHRLHFTNEGAADGRFLLMKNLAGLWIIQECMRHWEKSGQHHEWGDLLRAAADAAPFRSLFDPNDKRFEAPANMPRVVQEYCSEKGQCVPETPGAFARALFESLALKYRSVLASLESLTSRTFSTLRIVGGGSRNALLCQMVADACARRVVAGPAEATSLGNVMMQAIATGFISDFDEGKACVAESSQCLTYEPRATDSWSDAYARFQSLEVN
jgi:sugar (pentulose or hexulose) kinase